MSDEFVPATPEPVNPFGESPYLVTKEDSWIAKVRRFSARHSEALGEQRRAGIMARKHPVVYHRGISKQELKSLGVEDPIVDVATNHPKVSAGTKRMIKRQKAEALKANANVAPGATYDPYRQ